MTLCSTYKAMMIIYKRPKDGLSCFAIREGGKLIGTKVEVSR